MCGKQSVYHVIVPHSYYFHTEKERGRTGDRIALAMLTGSFFANDQFTCSMISLLPKGKITFT